MPTLLSLFITHLSILFLSFLRLASSPLPFSLARYPVWDTQLVHEIPFPKQSILNCRPLVFILFETFLPRVKTGLSLVYNNIVEEGTAHQYS